MAIGLVFLNFNCMNTDEFFTLSKTLFFSWTKTSFFKQRFPFGCSLGTLSATCTWLSPARSIFRGIFLDFLFLQRRFRLQARINVGKVEDKHGDDDDKESQDDDKEGGGLFTIIFSRKENFDRPTRNFS